MVASMLGALNTSLTTNFRLWTPPGVYTPIIMNIFTGPTYNMEQNNKSHGPSTYLYPENVAPEATPTD